MISELVPLGSCEHGTIYLRDDRPAVGATAWVDGLVYADREKTSVLKQPLTADRDGRLPGYVHGTPEVRASWRGRAFSTADAEAADRAAQERVDAERAAQHARDASEAAEAARKTRIAQIVEHAQEQERVRAENAAREAEERARAERLRQYELEREAERARLAAKPAMMPLGALPAPHPALPRGQRLTLVIPVDATGVELANATVQDYEPGYDPNFSTDDVNLSPNGFGIDTATGQAYYDTGSATASEAAMFGITPPDHLILVTK